jgi:cysteinyl-tRNA synthetase
MALRLYNTLTRQVDELKPIRDNMIRMYTCGPTVYHYAHIGNLRTFLFQDILRRYIRYKGFDLVQVMNITDVEDKIIARAREEGVSIGEYSKKYEEAFLKDLDTLRIQRPEIMPRATEHIDVMIELVSKLKEGGLTYERDGSTYYRIDRFSDYGRLSQLDPGDLRPSGQVDEDEYSKEDPRDFVLWKARKEGEAEWDSPFGPGRPGWHLECSAMSMKYLGESFDIHCGGVDLVFPHHENEIAQSEGATGKPFVRHWVHAAHLIVEGQKMSKSLGNFFTLRDLLDKGYSPLALRYLLASVHYRRQLNFTSDGVEQSRASIRRVNDFVLRVREVGDGVPANSEVSERVAEARSRFEAAMDEDLNTSAGLAALFELVRDVNVRLESRQVGSSNRDEILALLKDINQIFDVFDVEKLELGDDEIARLIDEREKARQDRHYARADEIRDLLQERGILLEDTGDGTRWKRQS